MIGTTVSLSAEGNPKITRFECSVFDGKYITGNVTAEYLCKLEKSRSDKAKARKRADAGEQEEQVIDMQNES